VSLPQPRTEDEAYAETGRDGAPPLVALPRRLTPFFGREALVERVVERVQDPGVRLLTLTGPGGVGKTRLALHVAQIARPAFADGTSFVSLAPVVDPALVLSEIGRGLGLTDGGERPIDERLADALSGRRVLLVLDNLEQVISVAPRIAELLRATDGVTVLATSRAPLHLDGEHELAVPPLTVPGWSRDGAASTAESEAVRFFLERARAVNPNLVLTPSGSDAVGAIVRRLDGLPLALELAAARTKVLSPEALLVRLERQLHVLTGGPQDRPERQRTMRDAIAWSYGLLDAAERALFRSLSVFRGGFSLEDAEAVLADGEPSEGGIDLLDGVTALVDQSLLVATDHDDGEVRFRMLETIREFGLEQLGVAGEAETTQRRFAEHWRALAEESWAHTAELDDLSRALAPLERNHDNVRAAHDWLEAHDPAGAADLAGSLSWFWYVKGHHAEALRRLRRLLAMPESDVPLARRPRLLLAAGWSSHFQGDTAAAVPFLEHGLELWRAQGDPWGTGFTLFVLGLIAEDTGAFEKARPLLHEAIDHLAVAGDRGSVASARFHLAVVAFGVGDVDTAEALVSEVLSSGLGPTLRIAGWALHLRGLLAHRRGDLASALRDQQEALRRFGTVRSATGIAEALAGMAVAAGAAGRPVAVRFWRWRSGWRRSAGTRSTSRSGPSTRRRCAISGCPSATRPSRPSERRAGRGPRTRPSRRRSRWS
jgi:predicted ATPase